MTKTKMILVWLAVFFIDVQVAEAAVNSDRYLEVTHERQSLERAGELNQLLVELLARRLNDELIAALVTRGIPCRMSDNFEFVGAGPKFAKVPAGVCGLLFFDRSPFGFIQVSEK